jgi:hypothetical protein
MVELIASVALASSLAAPGGAPPAPTLVWRDPQSEAEAYVRGLTRSGTSVTVTINGSIAPSLRYGPARGGVASFAVPWPADLPCGVYEVAATSRRGRRSHTYSFNFHSNYRLYFFQ